MRLNVVTLHGTKVVYIIEYFIFYIVTCITQMMNEFAGFKYRWVQREANPTTGLQSQSRGECA